MAHSRFKPPIPIELPRDIVRRPWRLANVLEMPLLLTWPKVATLATRGRFDKCHLEKKRRRRMRLNFEDAGVGPRREEVQKQNSEVDDSKNSVNPDTRTAVRVFPNTRVTRIPELQFGYSPEVEMM
jgi:hypothetical protein